MYMIHNPNITYSYNHRDRRETKTQRNNLDFETHAKNKLKGISSKTQSKCRTIISHHS